MTHTVTLVVEQIFDDHHLARVVDLINTEAYVSSINVHRVSTDS